MLDLWDGVCVCGGGGGGRGRCPLSCCKIIQKGYWLLL